ncbi:MAG: shikimate dehydrogenase [Thermodesulfobacteriota bacterium]
MNPLQFNTKTTLFGVIGDPVSHSMSPIMHNRAFAETGFNGAYLAFQVTDVAAAIAGMRSLGIGGFSVTIPHKINVMKYIDRIDDMAAKIGAVNTVVNRNGILCGYNTDCLGAIHALREKTAIDGKKVLLLGAGGAARAIGYGIQSQGGLLRIVNILEDEGRNLAGELGVAYHHLSEFHGLDYDILINSTPVGMSPDVADMPVRAEDLRPEKVVMDIIYNPLNTRLLMEAQKKGCLVVDGANMFVYQGAAQFEMWTGRTAPVSLMRETVLEALGR